MLRYGIWTSLGSVLVPQMPQTNANPQRGGLPATPNCTKFKPTTANNAARFRNGAIDLLRYGFGGILGRDLKPKTLQMPPQILHCGSPCVDMDLMEPWAQTYHKRYIGFLRVLINTERHEEPAAAPRGEERANTNARNPATVQQVTIQAITRTASTVI